MKIERIREKVKVGKYIKDDEILIITAYEPDAEEWEEDWKTRK